jgi:hypothetical protein
MKRTDNGDWTQFRSLPDLVEVDFHHGRRAPGLAYWDAMAAVCEDALNAIKEAHAAGRRYVLFRHGSSTSRPGQTTARSQIRKLMRSKEVTPFVVKRECVQHYSVFLVSIRARRGAIQPLVLNKKGLSK